MSNVLFLDIDGVLNHVSMPPQDHPCTKTPPRSSCRGLVREISRECVLRLNRLLQIANASVVLSTSRRLAFDVESLTHVLEDCGFAGKIIDETMHGGRDFWRARGHDPDRLERGHQIAAWLLEHPEVDHAVILDDDEDVWSLWSLLVRTKGYRGLIDSDVDWALNNVLPNSENTIREFRNLWNNR